MLRCYRYKWTSSDEVCQRLAAGWWFSPGIYVSSNKTDRHDITQILLKVVLNTITLMPLIMDNQCTIRAFMKSKYPYLSNSEGVTLKSLTTDIFDTIHMTHKVWYITDNNESSIHIKDIITPRRDTDSWVFPFIILFLLYRLCQILDQYNSHLLQR